ncbi:ethylene-responsive transcription factor ERF024-like [Argentina anserina]|uniref:ethylene-responsive transcription factor ERF024-like n=1 Tax=Argentina anserina TaxID=57926 RepID=UPI00217636DD|nr:ethylene-responsive transcription factor ERF024-like [Potentilla anserina]
MPALTWVISETYIQKKRNEIEADGCELQTSNDPEIAAVAYDVAALALKGQTAELNFPNSASSLPVPVSNSSRDIQTAATSAAAAIGAAATAMGTGNLATSSRPSTENGHGHVLIDDECVDEDLIFDMANVLLSMPEGMLLSPPRLDIAGDHDAFADEEHGNLCKFD